MKLTKFILPIAAIMLFVSVGADAQICVYRKGEEYRIEDAIQYKGDNVAFIKFCCGELNMCTANYFVQDKYLLTHIAAKYNRSEVLKYLIEDRKIPNDTFPLNLKTGEYEKTYTPLMFAAKNSGFESAKFLVDDGASVTKKNEYNEDALVLAKRTQNTKLIQYIQSAWNNSVSLYNPEKKKKELIKLLTINDIKDEIKNFQRSIKFNGFFS